MPTYTLEEALSLNTENSKTKQLSMEEAFALDSKEEQKDKETWADWIPIVSEIAPAIAVAGPAAAQGAAIGAPFFPPVGAAVGALVGGVAASAAATGVGRFAGESLEDLIEGRAFDPKKTIESAADAAGADALFSTIFGIAFPVIGKTIKIGKGLLKGSYTADESIELVANLQSKLKEEGASLMPPMVSKTGSKTDNFLFDVAKVSLVTKNQVKEMYSKYDDYMGGQIDQILKMTAGSNPKIQGQNLQELRNLTETSLNEIVSPFYKAIAQRGKGVPVDIGKPLDEMLTAFKVLNKGKPVKNPVTGKITQTVNWPPTFNKSSFTFLENLPRTLNFQEAHTRLSDLKAIRYEASLKEGISKKELDLFDNAQTIIETQMDNAANALNPTLKSQYDEVTALYREGRTVVDASYLKKAMRVLDPATIGGMLTADGLTVGIQQVKQLKKLAKEYQESLPKNSETRKALGLQEDVMEGIRRGYLENLLKVEGKGGPADLLQLQQKLKDPKFRLTFNEVFKETPAIPKKIDTLLEELNILNRAEGSEAAFALSVRGSELGAAKGLLTNPTSVIDQVLKFVPALMAKKAISEKTIDAQIALIRSASAATSRRVELPKSYFKAWGRLFENSGMGLGIAAGSLPAAYITE
tara:strand:+ start:3136 stop:5055 length:1920 start_codon:yes stop_codon:yes gene_type:complete